MLTPMWAPRPRLTRQLRGGPSRDARRRRSDRLHRPRARTHAVWWRKIHFRMWTTSRCCWKICP